MVDLKLFAVREQCTAMLHYTILKGNVKKFLVNTALCNGHDSEID